MPRFFKILSLSIFVFLLCFACIRLKKYKTGGFRISKLMRAKERLSLPEDLDSYEMRKILSQPFKYLGRGTQFYVFESADQKYVLKLLREDRVSVGVFDRFFLNPSKKDRMQKRADRCRKACQLALKVLPDETGVIFLHLKTSANLPTLHLFDRFQFRRLVDVNRYCFILQRRGVLIKEALEKANQHNDSFKGKKIIHSFFQTISNRIKNEISNSDSNLFENFAVLDEAVIEIDIGDFFLNPHLVSNRDTYEYEINRHALVFRTWIDQNWPDLLDYFDKIYQESLRQ